MDLLIHRGTEALFEDIPRITIFKEIFKDSLRGKLEGGIVIP